MSFRKGHVPWNMENMVCTQIPSLKYEAENYIRIVERGARNGPKLWNVKELNLGSNED